MAASFRVSHRASGRFHPLLFPLLALLTLAVALGLGWVMAWLYRSHWYVLGLVPAVAGLLLSGAVTLAVLGGACRNRAAGVGLALLAGLLLVLSAYHFDLIDLLGWKHAHRLDLLPGHIHDRLANDTLEDVAQAQQQAPRGPAAGLPQGKPKPPPAAPLDEFHYALNCFILALELFLCIGLPAAAAWSTGRRAFSETRRRWYPQHKTLVPGRAAQLLAQRLEEGQAPAARAELANLLASGGPFFELLLERFPAADGVEPEPAYLTLAAQRTQSQGPRLIRPLLRQVELAPDEIQLLLSLWPDLRDPSEAAGAAPDGQGAALPPGVVPAQIVAVPEPYGGQVLTRRNIVSMAALALTTLLLPTALGIGCIGLAAWFGEEELEDWQLAALLVGGFLFMGLGVLVGYYFGDFLPSRFFHRLSRRHVRERPDAWVDPDDPDALYIQVIPRRHWGKVMLENASDVGFLKLDADRSLLLFEGDQERWVIPAEGLADCGLEQFPMVQGQPHQLYTVAILKLRLPDRVEERPLALRHIHLSRRGPKEQERETRQLRDRILDLVPTGKVVG